MSAPDDADQPIEPEFLAMMNEVARALDRFFNKGERPPRTGFVLLTFRFGEEGRVNYISNADRESTVTAMENFVIRARSKPS